MIDENGQGYNSNETITKGQSVSPNTTVRGRMGPSARGDVDVYRVSVAAGQTLSAEVDSVRIADIQVGNIVCRGDDGNRQTRAGPSFRCYGRGQAGADDAVRRAAEVLS